MEKTCRLVHITYRENNRGPGREEYKDQNTLTISLLGYFISILTKMILTSSKNCLTCSSESMPGNLLATGGGRLTKGPGQSVIDSHMVTGGRTK